MNTDAADRKDKWKPSSEARLRVCECGTESADIRNKQCMTGLLACVATTDVAYKAVSVFGHLMLQYMCMTVKMEMRRAAASAHLPDPVSWTVTPSRAETGFRACARVPFSPFSCFLSFFG